VGQSDPWRLRRWWSGRRDRCRRWLAASKDPGSGTGPEGIPVQAGDQLAGNGHAGTGPPIDGIQCQSSEQVAYHIHAHLTLFVNGQAEQVSYGIGVAAPLQTSGSGADTFVDGGRCFYWLHTHAADGVIHIESPSQTTYTPGQFFDIWGQTLAPGQVGPAVGHVTAFVNDKPYSGDLRALQLQSHDNIQLDVGIPVVPPNQGDVDFSGTNL
jgi:hypothetical protein